MGFKRPSREEIERLKEEYPPGTRISLIKMDDPYSRLVPGDRATVTGVDDIGHLCCSWDREGTLRLDYYEDKYRKLTPEELADEETMSEQNQTDTGMNMDM